MCISCGHSGFQQVVFIFGYFRFEDKVSFFEISAFHFAFATGH